MDQTETIVAISSPRGEGGLGIVRLSGPNALGIATHVFRSRPPLGRRPRYVEFGQIVDGNQVLDRGLAWFLKAPNSYTGEDTVEISGHGSMVVLEALVQRTIVGGAVLAAPGEFTRRAFLNGRMDLTQAEAVIDIIRASSRAGLENAYGQASGRLSAFVADLKQYLIQALSYLELGLDFAEEDNDQVDHTSIETELRHALAMATRLLDTFEGARRRQTGFAVCLLGLPNAGKSTLLNSLLGEEKAIVSPEPGTTRDLVEGRTVWSGETVRLIDTAGFSHVGDTTERLGVERTRQGVADADLVLIVIDASEAWRADHEELLQLSRAKPALMVLNKCDLPGQLCPPPDGICLPTVRVSALNGDGLVELQNRGTRLLPQPSSVDGMGLVHERHHDCLQRMATCTRTALRIMASWQPYECAVLELRSALSALSEMLGEEVEEEILDRVFSQFCIGK